MGAEAGGTGNSFNGQYKGFVYLTDVTSETQGAFAFVPRSNNPVLRLASLVHRITSRGNRYTDKFVNTLAKMASPAFPVLLKPAFHFSSTHP